MGFKFSSSDAFATIECTDGASKIFKPTTSVRTTRYERTSRVDPSFVNIPAGFGSYANEAEPRYLPLAWSAFTHPEGQAYFVCHAEITVVTEAYLYSPEIQNKVAFWIDEFNARLLSAGIRLPGTSELFLELDESSDSCGYYLVDYASRVEFWIEEVDSDDLDIPTAVSLSHRRLTLQEHFWTHVEHFPSHHAKEISLERDELVHVFSHARADQMTSANSTFPYSAKQCTEFLELLNSAPCTITSPYSTALIARLWSVVYNHRFSIHYGEEHARLSRDQSILDIPKVSRSIPFRMASRLLFKIPDAHLQVLDSLYVDNLVYVEHWRDAMTAIHEEWLMCSYWGFGLMIVDMLSLLVPGSNRMVALASMLLCNITLVSAIVHLAKHHRATKWHAADAAEYLADARSESSGFQWTALAFSLPKASLLWALGIFSCQGLLWLLAATNIYAVSAVVAFMCLVALCSQASRVTWQMPGFRGTSKVEDSVV